MLGIQTRVCKNGRHRRNHGAMESEEVTFTIYFLKTWVKKVGPYVSFSFFLSFFLSFLPPKIDFKLSWALFSGLQHMSRCSYYYFSSSHTRRYFHLSLDWSFSTKKEEEEPSSIRFAFLLVPLPLSYFIHFFLFFYLLYTCNPLLCISVVLYFSLSL